MSFTCPEKQTSPTIPENQLGGQGRTLTPLLRSPHLLAVTKAQPLHPTSDPDCKKVGLIRFFKNFILFLEKKKSEGRFQLGNRNNKHTNTRADSLNLWLHFHSFISTRILDAGEANSTPTL